MANVNRRQQELICITLVVVSLMASLVDSGILHPAQYNYIEGDKQLLTGWPHFPNQEMTNSTATTNSTQPVNDTAVSFLFKVKIYPFRRLVEQPSSKSKATARFGGPEMGVVKRVAGDNGVMAFGIDLGLPGSVGGLGYGHQIPFQIISFSSISFSSSASLTPSQSANGRDL